MTKKIRCLIVEDEPLAAEILEDYVQQTPHLDLIQTCVDAIFALEVLQKETIDLIFLDIHLPKLKGLDFVRTLSQPPKIILTTAYHQYAVEAYDLEVVDYLLKPIEFSRFLKAVNRVSKLLDNSGFSSSIQSNFSNHRPARFFNVNKKKVKVYLDEILYIESLKEYARIHTSDRRIVTKFQLGDLMDFLADDNFLRIHRSYVIAKNKVEAFSATEVEIKGMSLPIGRSYRQLVMRELEK